jgi:hypothetical protein
VFSLNPVGQKDVVLSDKEIDAQTVAYDSGAFFNIEQFGNGPHFVLFF